MVRDALAILMKPRWAIHRMLTAHVAIRSILMFLFWVGLVRGVLEVVWLFAMSRRVSELAELSGQWSWWMMEAGPFIVANILTAYFRWALYSLVCYAALRFLQARVDFARVLRVFAAVMILYVLTILVNFLHCAMDLPMLQVRIAERYMPSFGIGQGVSSVLVLWWIWTLGRQVGLDRSGALLSAVLVFAVERAFYFFAAWAYFRLPLLSTLSEPTAVFIANHATSVVSLLGTGVLLWLGYRINAKATT